MKGKEDQFLSVGCESGFGNSLTSGEFGIKCCHTTDRGVLARLAACAYDVVGVEAAVETRAIFRDSGLGRC